MSTTVYISGPMTGYVNYNREAFHRAAAHLIAKGYDVVNPAAEDDKMSAAEELAMSHADYLRRDIVLLLDCDLIYTLPGWRHSKGATLEMAVARGCGIDRLKDADIEAWRTFEGEPEQESPEVDRLFREAKVIPLSDLDRRLAETEGLDELAARLQAEGPDEFPTGYYRHVAEERLRESIARLERHSAPRPGDKFPNVAYVRDMTGKTAAELADNVRRLSTVGMSTMEVAEAVNARYVAECDGRGSE